MAAYRPGPWATCGPRQSTTSLARCGIAANAPDPQPRIPSLTSNRRRMIRLVVRPVRSTTVYRASGSPIGTTCPMARPAGRSPASSRHASHRWATTTWLTVPPGGRSTVVAASRRIQRAGVRAGPELERQAVEDLRAQSADEPGPHGTGRGSGRRPVAPSRSERGRDRRSGRAGSSASSGSAVEAPTELCIDGPWTGR